jgi:hypothetical protein
MPAVGLYFALALLTGRFTKYGWAREAILAVSLIAMSSLAILYAHGFWVV